MQPVMGRAILLLAALWLGSGLLFGKLGGGPGAALAALLVLPGVPMLLWTRRVLRIARSGVYEQLRWTHALARGLLFRFPLVVLGAWLGRRFGGPRVNDALDDLDEPARYDRREDGWRYADAFRTELKAFAICLLFTLILLGGVAQEAVGGWLG